MGNDFFPCEISYSITKLKKNKNNNKHLISLYEEMFQRHLKIQDRQQALHELDKKEDVGAMEEERDVF